MRLAFLSRLLPDDLYCDAALILGGSWFIKNGPTDDVVFTGFLATWAGLQLALVRLLVQLRLPTWVVIVIAVLLFLPTCALADGVLFTLNKAAGERLALDSDEYV